MDIVEIAEKLGKIDGKLDVLIARESKNEDRLHAVEKKTWYASGIAVVLSVAAAKLGFILPPAH